MSVFDRLRLFWARISDGMELSAIWEQLQRETRSSYAMYAQEAVAQPAPARRGPRQRRRVVDFLWAILLKLSPPRRILVLLAVVGIIVGGAWVTLAALLLLALLALEIADRVSMKRDLEIAREIQLWLLPTLAPVVEGASVAFANLPANTVSGDFYDAFPRANGKLMLTVADVAGKGLPAALVTATFQASLRTLGAEALELPAITLALNRYACGHSAGGTRFTTAFLAEYDPLTRQLQYCNAGHNPPLLRRANGNLEKLDRGGVPLGILAAAEFECGEVTLAEGDTLVVYSDGLTESFSPTGEDYGEARLMLALQRAMAGLDTTAEAVLAAIVTDCAQFRQGARQQDDLTCLVLRVQSER